MTPGPKTATAPSSRPGAAGALDSATLALLSTLSLGGVRTVSLGQPVGRNETQPWCHATTSVMAADMCEANAGSCTEPHVAPWASGRVALAAGMGLAMLGGLVIYPRFMNPDPNLVPQASVPATALVIPIDPAPKAEAATPVTTVDAPYEEASAQAKWPASSPLPAQLPIGPVHAKSGAAVSIDKQPESKTDQKVDKVTAQKAEKAPPMLQEAEDKLTATMATATQLPQTDAKRKEAGSGRLIAIAPDGQSAAFIEPKTRTPVQVRAGSVLSNGEKVLAINGKTGILTTDKREYVLE